jgi:hypothetical protein
MHCSTTLLLHPPTATHSLTGTTLLFHAATGLGLVGRSSPTISISAAADADSPLTASDSSVGSAGIFFGSFLISSWFYAGRHGLAPTILVPGDNAATKIKMRLPSSLFVGTGDSSGLAPVSGRSDGSALSVGRSEGPVSGRSAGTAGESDSHLEVSTPPRSPAAGP